MKHDVFTKDDMLMLLIDRCADFQASVTERLDDQDAKLNSIMGEILDIKDWITDLDLQVTKKLRLMDSDITDVKDELCNNFKGIDTFLHDLLEHMDIEYEGKKHAFSDLEEYTGPVDDDL